MTPAEKSPPQEHLRQPAHQNLTELEDSDGDLDQGADNIPIAVPIEAAETNGVDRIVMILREQRMRQSLGSQSPSP
ncbi:MAG: hypothetical protein WBF93_10520 [Pirellulales bacterium]|nr:hypothetical protein [Pirellulales bacterium]